MTKENGEMVRFGRDPVEKRKERRKKKKEEKRKKTKENPGRHRATDSDRVIPVPLVDEPVLRVSLRHGRVCEGRSPERWGAQGS
ncbi:hypothetical protein H4N49_26205 [Streptomyces sp. DHE17-7]|nr:hypothetical protein [Streptomyces sp. DHE17-7]MBJ6621876.1 hypothetical protein [Streptomyces sp. DHE17-7]